MSSENITTGKIAFMFPAQFNVEGASSPTLNFKARYDGTVAMSIGISFLELDPKSPYFVKLSLKDSHDNDVPISSGMDAIPPNQIDPIRKSSFLTASFNFKAEIAGTHKFTCELIQPLSGSMSLDSKNVLFNIIAYSELTWRMET
ncbi:hypothetical protein TUM17580_31820 [Citrobacter farmeri]|uniref:hypothetical protein n=1 Tax=Citrobacter farmeri TaxID=67824 RepID=UPI001B998F3D|nr:hypothetical protein [Citrobacter farmeri]HBC6430094.1 hypothetical protein [Citrobacter amalonaticus]EKU0079882.1 hypothetical protein [Citrobacter farmeri]EKZ2528309.1 hypothetical protein [Citrobacter farmeri]GJL47123.1 hypothetical protein TUM17580_31820 [Citrobacter farmeri]HCB2209082.1 hypothetical protein [Citrobacter farmeri]